MAGNKDERDTEDLLQLIHSQQQVLDSLRKRSEESERIQAEMEEEAERADAWLTSSGKWDLWDEDAKQFAVPENGWPAGHVRKPKERAKPDAPVEEERESEPDTLMHRMLKQSKGFSGG